MSEGSKRPAVDHFLKALPRWFQGYASGTKPWSLRWNDRDFQPGDWCIMYEWFPGTLREVAHASGRAVAHEIISVWREVPKLEEDYVVLSLGPPSEVAPEYLNDRGLFEAPPRGHGESLKCTWNGPEGDV